MQTRLIVATLVVFLSSTSIFSDELILKDGRKIEWKLLSDEGDHYKVTTTQDTKITVNKDDVESFNKIKPVAPLTGATFTFAKDRKIDVINLLALSDPTQCAIAGEWNLSRSILSGGGEGTAKFEIPYEAPEEYDFTIRMARVAGSHHIGIGLVGGGRQFLFMFIVNGNWNGPTMVDGKSAKETGLMVQKPVFSGGNWKTIVFKMRKTGFAVTVDGDDLFVWKDDWNRLSLHRSFAVRKSNSLFLESYQCSFKVSEMTVRVPR